MATRFHTSAAAFIVLATLSGACTPRGDGAGAAPPPDVSIGTFSAVTATSLAGLLSREPLVAVDWDGRPANRLAESSAQSPDGQTLTITLRPRAFFHDGTPVTAEVVSGLLAQKPALMKVVESIAVDGRTLVIRLTHPRALRLEDLSEYAITDDNANAMRTGPFKLVSTGERFVLERFDQYHQGPATVRRVEIRQYPNHRAAWTAMMRGEVNFLHEISRDAVDFVQAGGNVQAYPTLRPYYYALTFNQKHPALGRREVRVALDQAVNRDEIVSNGMRGHGRVAESPFWAHHWAVPAGRVAAVYNPDAARVRLDAADLPVARKATDAMPSRFSFNCLVPAGDSRFERIALVLQRQLSNVGVDMRLEPVPLQTLYVRLKSGKFDAFLFEMTSGRTLTWPYDWWRSRADQLVATGYSSADAALDRMRAAGTDEEVRIAVADVIRVLREDPPALFLVWPYDSRAADTTFTIPHQPERDIFGTLWQAQRTVPGREGTP